MYGGSLPILVTASPSAPLPESDPFFGASELDFRQSMDQPFLGSYAVLDGTGAVRARIRRSGNGWGVLLMDYVLVDAADRPLAYVRQPRPKHFIGYNLPFTLTDPYGTELGELRFHPFTFRSTRFSLVRQGREVLCAEASLALHDFSIKGGSVELATLHVDWIALPGGVHLKFSPLAITTSERILVIGLTAFLLVFTGSRQFPTFR